VPTLHNDNRRTSPYAGFTGPAVPNREPKAGIPVKWHCRRNSCPADGSPADRPPSRTTLLTTPHRPAAHSTSDKDVKVGQRFVLRRIFFSLEYRGRLGLFYGLFVCISPCVPYHSLPAVKKTAHYPISRAHSPSSHFPPSPCTLSSVSPLNRKRASTALTHSCPLTPRPSPFTQLLPFVIFFLFFLSLSLTLYN